jgi:hypothetical protein
MRKFVDWESAIYKSGQKIHRLTILKTCKLINTYRYYAFCQCECGSPPKYIRIDGIISGHTTSCGCVHKEVITTQHGKWGHPLFSIYKGMLSRCYNTSDKRFNCYGGRGISICDRWLNILNFIEDMYPTFKKGLTIERIDNNGNYSPENCRWATRKEQNRNYRRNINITHNGKTLCLVEWSEETGIPYGTLWDRIKVRGWSIEKSLNTPPIKTK